MVIKQSKEAWPEDIDSLEFELQLGLPATAAIGVDLIEALLR